jgi:hypothetical protein
MVVMIRTLKMNSTRRRQAAHKARSSGSIVKRGSRKRLIQRNCSSGSSADISEVPSSDGPDRRPRNLEIENNTQGDDMAIDARKRARLWSSLPPTGGIALLIEILAREALKDVMAERSKGPNPRRRD